MRLALTARIAVAVVGMSLVAACQTGATGLVASDMDDADQADQHAAISQGTRRVIITYLIAHGMAEGYVMSGRATSVGMLSLVHADQAALSAIRQDAIDPSWSGVIAASGAVHHLLDATAAMETGSRSVRLANADAAVR